MIITTNLGRQSRGCPSIKSPRISGLYQMLLIFGNSHTGQIKTSTNVNLKRIRSIAM